MSEIEHFFQCPYCFENISMLLDVSLDEEQSYIEDCEVCCNPIQITYGVTDGQIDYFTSSEA